MSFRSAWRHVKPSPSIAHVIPRPESTTSLEPTLVVTSSRPASAHDPKTDGKGDKPVETSVQETAEQPAASTSVVKDTETDVDVPPQPQNGESQQAEMKNQEPTTKEGSAAQETRWFAWWGGSASDKPTAPKAQLQEPKKSSDSERPSTTAPVTNPTTEGDKVTVTAPAPATTVSSTEPPAPPTSPPAQPLTINAPPTTSESSSGSYLSWIWSSKSPPKPTNPEPSPENPTSSEPPVAPNGITTKLTKTPEPQEQKSAPNPAELTPQISQTSIPNPLITTLPQTRSSWMSFWSRSESIPDLERNSGPETMQVPENIDPQGRLVIKQNPPNDMAAIPRPLESNGSIKSKKQGHTPSTSVNSIPGTPTKPPSSPTKADSPNKTPQKGKNGKDKVKQPPPPNHVLPAFETVYPSLPPKDTFLSRVTKAILPASGHIAPGAIHSHPKRCSPHPIRKAVAIGIHGFFPLRIIRNILGEPTGTSVKFATLASEAIHRYAAAQYGSAAAVEVVKIALEGEGTVSTRVDMLWKNLKSKDEWMDHIREADLILVACHSQGSPVGAGIMAKLVEEGIVNDRTRLGLLCVAGIHLGPATDVGQRVVIKAYNAIESEAARELYGIGPKLWTVIDCRFSRLG